MLRQAAVIMICRDLRLQRFCKDFQSLRTENAPRTAVFMI